MSSARTEGATEVVGEIAGSSSQVQPPRSDEVRLNEDIAMVERVSHNGGVERVDCRCIVTPLHVVTNMRISVSDLFRDYPGWKIPLSEYVATPWKIVALRDVCQRVAGWVRSQDPNRHRSARGGGGCRTKASQLEKVNRALGDTNVDLTRRLEQANSDVRKAHDDLRHRNMERTRMLVDIADLRRDLSNLRASGGKVEMLTAEINALRSERDRLQARLDESERENHSLLRDILARRHRRSPSSSRSPSPKRRRRSDGGRRSRLGS